MGTDPIYKDSALVIKSNATPPNTITWEVKLSTYEYGTESTLFGLKHNT